MGKGGKTPRYQLTRGEAAKEEREGIGRTRPAGGGNLGQGQQQIGEGVGQNRNIEEEGVDRVVEVEGPEIRDRGADLEEDSFTGEGAEDEGVQGRRKIRLGAWNLEC